MARSPPIIIKNPLKRRKKMDSEKWDDTSFVVLELEFYQKKYEHLQDIEDRQQEIESECYSLPIGYIDDQTGEYRVSGGTVENQVIKKIETEQALNKLKERVIDRCNRFETAFLQLSEEEQDLISYVYLDDSPLTVAVQARLLGYQNVNEFRIAERKALKNLYRYISVKRDEHYKKVMESHRQELSENLKRMQEAYNDGSLYNFKPKPKKKVTFEFMGQMLSYEV